MAVPLSLQDTCMLHILFRVNEFPVNNLALLPLVIRQRLFQYLPRADILHLCDTALFLDLHQDELKLTENTARENLLEVILQGDSRSLDQIVSFPRPGFEFICNTNICRESLAASFEASLSEKLVCWWINTRVVPKHLKQFIEFQYCTYFSFSNGPLEYLEPYCLELARPLLNYCNMHCAPPKLMIDCYGFMKTTIWKNYRDTDQESNKATNLVIPFLQQFLSSVEELTLKSRDSEQFTHHDKVPYVLLYNIITSNQPRLKHLNVCNAQLSKKCLELFCTCEIEGTAESSIALPVSQKPKAYQLESISMGFQNQHIAQSIIAYQMQTLRSVTIQDLGLLKQELSNEQNVSSLLCSLNELQKQPQFQSLHISKTSFIVACELIVTFLTTPTSHEQSLTITACDKELEESVVSTTDANVQEVKNSNVNKSRKRSNSLESSKILPFKVIKQSFPNLTSQSLPETNSQYKCLDLGLSCSDLHSWLFSHPELELKKLGIRTQDLTLVPDSMMIQVEHVTFNSPAEDSTDMPSISYAHLEALMVSNPVLKRLARSQINNHSKFLIALNHCLSVLSQQGRGLDEIILNSVKFNTRNGDEVKEFFIRLIDISHNNGTVLVVHHSIQLFDEYSRLLVDFSNYFQEILKEDYHFYWRHDNVRSTSFSVT